MKKYIVIFFIANLVVGLLFGVISLVVDGDVGSGILATLTAAMYAGMKFCDDHNRYLDRNEKRALINGSFLATLVLSLILGSLLALIAYIETGKIAVFNLSVPVLTSIIVVSLGITYLMLVFTYGPCLRWVCRKRLEKKSN